MGDITDSQSEIEFLANKSAQGKLVIVTANYTTNGTGTIVSYTPASGQTFVLYSATFENVSSVASGSPLIRLRNNGTSRFLAFTNVGTSSPAIVSTSPVKGDQLIGDGVKIYDWYLDLNGGTFTLVQVLATIVGYLL